MDSLNNLNMEEITSLMKSMIVQNANIIGEVTQLRTEVSQLRADNIQLNERVVVLNERVVVLNERVVVLEEFKSKYDVLSHTLSAREVGSKADIVAMDLVFPGCRKETYKINSLNNLISILPNDAPVHQ